MGDPGVVPLHLDVPLLREDDVLHLDADFRRLDVVTHHLVVVLPPDADALPPVAEVPLQAGEDHGGEVVMWISRTGAALEMIEMMIRILGGPGRHQHRISQDPGDQPGQLDS